MNRDRKHPARRNFNLLGQMNRPVCPNPRPPPPTACNRIRVCGSRCYRENSQRHFQKLACMPVGMAVSASVSVGVTGVAVVVMLMSLGTVAFVKMGRYSLS